MSRIKELINSNESVLVFDIDGVLAIMEFGIHNHFMDDDEWNDMVSKNINFYTEDKVSKTMKNFLSTKDMSKVYVVTKINEDNEIIQKQEYANKYYKILKENVYCVKNDSDKVNELLRIKDKYKELPDENLIMIDDTVEILNDIMENTNFSTAHISSFLDM